MTTKSINDIELKKVHGRTLAVSNGLPLFWNGSGVEFNFKGSSLKMTIEADFERFEPWIDVVVDGVRYQKRPLEKGEHEITIWHSTEIENGMDAPCRNIRIIRDTPAMPGDASTLLLIKDVSFDGIFEEVADKKLKLEFIGDSITSGEGCMGVCKEQDWNSSCFDFITDYANMVSTKLNADCNIISQSGWGLCWSWYGNPNEIIPTYYDKICGLVPNGKLDEYHPFDEWDFNLYVPDVIIINLGTNDAGAFQKENRAAAKSMNFNNVHELDENGLIPEEDVNSISKGVVDFLSHLRSKNENAVLIWVYGMLAQNQDTLEKHMQTILESSVEKYKSMKNDEKAFYMTLPKTEADEFGSRCHPGFKSHVKSADIIINKINEILTR